MQRFLFVHILFLTETNKVISAHTLQDHLCVCFFCNIQNKRTILEK